MSRGTSSKVYSPQQIRDVHAWRTAGVSNTEISNRLGITVATFTWHRSLGKFGILPSRKGKGDHGRRLEDNEKTGTLFGLTDWPSRQAEIRNSWSSETACQRSRQQLPGGEQLYCHFEKLDLRCDPFKNPNIGKNKPPNIHRK